MDGDIDNKKTQMDFHFIEPESDNSESDHDPSKELTLNSNFLEKRKEEVGLIDHFFLTDVERQYSHLLLFYDSVPKFIRGSVDRIDGVYLPIVHKSFTFEKKQFEVEVKPVRIEVEEDGKTVERDYYPGTREELVEDALRKIAADGRGKLMRDPDTQALSLVVEFTIYAIQQILKRSNKMLAHNDIKQALRVLRYAPITIKGNLKDLGIEKEALTTILSEVYITTRGDSGPENTNCWVQFNPIVTKSILRGNIRLFNYLTSMSFKQPLARFLYKRLVTRFTYADDMRDFNLLMTTIFEESGEKLWAQMNKNVKRVNTACDELIKKGVIEDYDCEIIYSPRRKNKIIDAKYLFYPSRKFIQEMIFFNQRFNDTKRDIMNRSSASEAIPIEPVDM